MSLTRKQVLDIVLPRFDAVRGQRFTQDTPVLVDVWVAFGEAPDKRRELLLTPHRDSNVQTLAAALKPRLENPGTRVVYNQSHVLTQITYRQLLRAVMPLSAWWTVEVVRPYGGRLGPLLSELAARKGFEEMLMLPASQDVRHEYSEDLLDFVRIAGLLAIGKPAPKPGRQRAKVLRTAVEALAELMADLPEEMPERPVLWNVFCNRRATGAVWQSRNAIKADAAVRLFDISCRGMRWAVIDSGIDATHPAFVDTAAAAKDKYSVQPHKPVPSQYSRVKRTYDFTRLRDVAPSEGALDWDRLEPLLRIAQDDSYEPPVNEHGTHVAGILGANWRVTGDDVPAAARRELPDQDIAGVCPDIELYDLRVIGDDGVGDEFSIMAALQFVRHLNRFKDNLVVQGVNLSLSLPHAVDSFACGSTPICEECNHLANSGVVVVAAAGNRGWRVSQEDGFESYQGITITDPGNADLVITVGATHRLMPHKYGVSYFSSRGPTGDGRMKPDLVAPGEKIESVIPGLSWVTLDGSSMAAPHVSGAAALLMARHRELVGQPGRIKRILCDSATDLGRERAFQGAGMLDVLRALQCV